jgi:hypothetical protein
MKSSLFWPEKCEWRYAGVDGPSGWASSVDKAPQEMSPKPAADTANDVARAIGSVDFRASQTLSDNAIEIFAGETGQAG